MTKIIEKIEENQLYCYVMDKKLGYVVYSLLVIIFSKMFRTL